VSISYPVFGIQMDKDHLPLLEDPNPERRCEISAGTGSANVALTEAIKILLNVSGREAEVRNAYLHQGVLNHRKQVTRIKDNAYYVEGLWITAPLFTLLV